MSARASTKARRTWENVKKTFERLKRHEPGERFGAFYREQQDRPIWMKVLFFALAFVAFAVGVVLVFIPGPAVVFFAISLALVSTQSRFVARAMDKGEVRGRKHLASLKAWWRRKRERPTSEHHRRKHRRRERKAGPARG